MTSVEKRRSSRRSRGHRKHSNGGFSSASSGGSFLDETDREVSNLTDRAFRSLCIGDEAVYNDSDLSLSSPSTQRDRQLAFSQDRGIVETDREEQKRAEQENFSLRVQQYGQDWIFGGMSGGDTHRDPQWDVYGERTQGMVSATFQHSFVETSQQEKSLRERELSLYSNGALELSSQQRRSRSRVSSLVKAFNADGHGDGTGIDEKLSEWSDGTSWDRSALMSFQRELSEFSTSYQQTFDSNRFPSASPFTPQNTNFYSSQVEAMAQMAHSSASAYIKHSMAAQVNSNFFMHSEFSPFRLWRDHNRFPFQQGELSGFMHCSEFPKWYQTPMYNELSYRDPRHQRNTLAPAAPPARSISTSTVLQKSSAVEKRCESELAYHYPHRKATHNLGTNKLPPQRPSTVSPTTEMSRRVRDTISSVKALQQKVKMTSEQNMTTDETAYRRAGPYGREHLDNPVDRAVTVEPNVFSSNTRSSFGTSQLLTPSVNAHQEAETSNFHHYEVSPQPVEHPPVRAESRGATPEVRMSSYKSRATSLLFNLKDNRKRVKSTYSPTKFKALDALEKNKQEPHETVIDIPAFSDPDIQPHQLQEPRWTNAAVNQYHNPERANTSQNPENTSVQTQSQIVHPTGFSSFIPENYTNYQLANGQNPYENVASFTPYKHDYFGSMEELQHPYSAVDTARLNPDNNQSREYLIRKANTEQAFNETVGGVSSKVTRYEQLIENKQNYKNASSLEKWRQTNSQDTENVSLRTDVYSSKQDMAPLMERPRVEIQSSRNKDIGKVDWKESLVLGTSSLQKANLVSVNVSNQLELEQEQKTNEIKDGILVQKHNRCTVQDGKSQNNLYCTTENPTTMKNTSQNNQFLPIVKEQEKHQQTEVKPQFEIQQNSNPSLTHQIKERKATDFKSEQITAENTQDYKAEETKSEPKTQVHLLKTDPAEFISTQKIGSENIWTEEFKLEPTKPEILNEGKKEQIKEEEREGEQKEHFTEKESGRDGKKKTKSAQTRVQQLPDEPKHIPEKAKHEHMTEEQVKAEQAESEKLKEEHIKNKLAKAEEAGMGGIKQAEVKKPARKTMNPEQVKEEQLFKKQADGEQMEAEQVKTENVNPEKAKVEKAEQLQQVRELQTKAKYIKRKDEENIVIKSEGPREVDKKKDLSQVTAEKPTIPTCPTKDTHPAERKTEQATLKENKLDRCRAELSTTENLLERSDHLTAKLTAAQHARREPDKVEQVKTELAKAKAELAKIKEKMRGEQKEKVKTNLIMKEDGAVKKNSIPLSINVDKNKDGKKQDQSLEIQTHSVADDYERLREKYGFINTVETNKMSAGNTTSADANKIDNTPPDEAGTKNNAKNNSLACLFIAPENKKEVSNVTETQPVHAESSKQFKLSGANSPNNSCNETNGDTFDKLKCDCCQKLEKSDSVVSQQRDSDLDKLLPLQRKAESNEQSADLGKDPSIAPPRSLSQKERAQTKQDILTSKIKAHAEKEISAIKEKGFALRDGFIGKNPSKHLASGQSVSIRQRPSSLEVPKNHENTVSNNVSPKLQMEPSGIQTRPAKCAPPQSCAATTGKPAATTTQLENLEKSENQTANRNMSLTEGKKRNKDGIKSLVQSKEQVPENKQVNHTDSGKQKNELQQNVKDEIFNKKKEVRTQDAGVEAVNVKPVTTEEGKHEEAANMDLAPQNVTGSKEMTLTDDSLQIMGIVVTVRERKPSESISQPDSTAKNAETEKECNKPAVNKGHPSQGHDENNTLKEANIVKEIKKTQSVVKDNLAKVVQNNYPEKHMTGNIPEKRTNLQQDSSKMNIELQGETQPEPVTEQGVIAAKDKTLTETTQQNTTDKPKNVTTKTAKENLAKSSAETKKDEKSNQEQMQTARINDNLTISVLKSKINSIKDDSSIKQLSVNDTTSFHPSSDMDGQSALTQCPNNESLQLNNNQSKEDITDVDVHIDRIAIRVVPAETKNANEEKAEQSDNKAFPSDTKHQQVVSSSWDEKANTSNHELFSKGFTLARSEQKKEESLEDKLAVQNVLSSVRKLSDSLKASKQSTNSSGESRKAENKKTESKIQLVEEDYFQIQGVTETSSEAPRNITTAEEKLKERELPGLLPNVTAISNESCKEIKSEAFVFSLDQRDKKASSENIQDENIKKEKLEIKDTLSSNQTDSSMERWSKTEKGEAGQLDPISKRKEEQLHLSTTERWSSRESQPTKTNPAPEKSEVKQKPRGRTSTIPEISALADYARLKVIVAEDKDETTVHEFPPNKKEGFIPLIHTRHSRPPVFTEDRRNRSVKEKKLPNKMETSVKVNKEPKTTGFPKMEKEHQRTGMFKLGDKEKQEKIGLDAKVNVSPFKDKDKDLKETNRSSAQTEQMGREKLDASTCQPKNHQAMASPFVASSADNSSEVLPYLHPTFGQMHHKTEQSADPKKNASSEIQQDKDTRANVEDERTSGIKQETIITQNKETKIKQQDQQQQSKEEGVSRNVKEQNKEDIRIKNMIEERRASLAEEERRATRREEERRAREREAVAIMIKERREKQKQAEIKAEDERKTKKREEEQVLTEEENQTKQKVETKMTESDKRRMIIEDEIVAKLKEKRMKQQKEERNAHVDQKMKTSEEKREAVQVEQQRRPEQEEHLRRFAPEEHQKRESEENKMRAALKQQQRLNALEKQQRKASQEEMQRKALQEEQQRKLVEEQQKRVAQEEQQKKIALEEKQKRAAFEEQQRRAAQAEQQRTVAQEEQKRRAAQEEQQRKAAQAEQQRTVAQEEQKRRAAQAEQQRRAAQAEQQRKVAQEEQKRRAAQEEQQRKLAEEQQIRAAQEEQQRKLAEEQQIRAAQAEQQRRVAQEEQRRKAAQEEQQRKLAEEQQRRAALEEQQRKFPEEQQRRVAQEEQQKRVAQEEQQKRIAEELQRRAAQEERQMRALHEQQSRVEEELWRKAVQEKQQRRSALIEEQRQIKQIKEKIVVDIQEETAEKPKEDKKPAQFSEEERINLIHEQEQVQQHAKEQREERHLERQWMKTLQSEEKSETENILKQREEKQDKHKSSTLFEKNTFAQEPTLATEENDAQAEKKEDQKLRRVQIEKQKRAAQKMDALQYYAITSTDTEKNVKERQLSSPPRPHKPNTAASPAPPLPRSNTSSPALGVKPLMFRVKDNTFRGSSFTKSVKPRFHKNFGEDFWMGSPSDRTSDRAEDDQETMRRSAGTPVSPEKGFNQFSPVGEPANFLSESSPQDYSSSVSHQRPYSRRSMAMDDESRSVVSSMSEDVESFATSATDVADIRGLFDGERPESACSVSSDVSRSLGKPPTVPPKSEKALRRAQRLTSHRIKKELAKAATESPVRVDKEASTFPSSTEVCSSNHYAVASPHFSAPVAFAHAPALGSGLPSSHTEHQSHHSFHASPHATGPVSLPMSSPHAGSASSLPSLPHHASGKASKPAAPKTVAHVSSSPTPHLTNPHSAPVTQYQVESSPYHPSYPLTQRKVLQDLGSGQYFLVDVPVPVKTKTFFDPQTGKYVQLNVRRSQPQQSYPQAHLQPQQALPQASFAAKPFVFYQGYHRYPQSHHPAVINSAHPNRSSGPPALQQQPGESNISTDVLQDSEVHQYIPEKTNYMDTVNDINRIHNTVNNSQDLNESLSECNSNNQVIESSVCENDNATNSLYQSRDIIAMSELEDFMEVSDW